MLRTSWHFDENLAQCRVLTRKNIQREDDPSKSNNTIVTVIWCHIVHSKALFLSPQYYKSGQIMVTQKLNQFSASSAAKSDFDGNNLLKHNNNRII